VRLECQMKMLDRYIREGKRVIKKKKEWKRLFDSCTDCLTTPWIAQYSVKRQNNTEWIRKYVEVVVAYF
jgi:hypothetical protein